MTIPSFDETHLTEMSDVLESAVTHGELSAILEQMGMPDWEGASKRKRIFYALRDRQRKDRCGNNVGKFLETVVDPARFVGREQAFSDCRDRLNLILVFSGLGLQESGKLTMVAPARTLAEAQHKAGRLRVELSRRRVHQRVLDFCRAELVHDNYFHAVLEATKSVAERIRQMTGLTTDGAELVDRAFGGERPLLALNSLRTDTEQSEQRGFANLVKGAFGTFRNVTAHAPKIVWPIGEQDALDLLSLLSYVHRRLDDAILIPYGPREPGTTVVHMPGEVTREGAGP